jgi:flagellar biosynthesis protein FlhG
MVSMAHKFWTFGGGKGGVGKSFLTASIGVLLARLGKSVIAVDADLGSANLHTYLGIKSPGYSLIDILENRATPEEVLLPTSVPGLRLISCASDILGMANPMFGEKERIMGFISGLNADYILVDLGAGTSFNVLDFFNMSDEGIVIVSPDPASMQNAYAFIKSAIYRRIQRHFSTDESVTMALKRFREETGDRPRTMMDFYDLLCTSDPGTAERVAAIVDSYRPLLLINMANSDEDQRVAEILESASRKFLNVDIRFCGLIVSDPAVRRASQRMTILDFDEPQGIAARQIRQAAMRMLGGSETAQGEPPGESRTAPATPIMGLNDNLEFMGKELHIQTEDLGYTGRCITTQVFCEGRVILSTKTEYPSSVRDAKDRSQVADLMHTQHFNVIRELENRKVRILRPA